jgi:hypothetical protein
MITGYTFYDIFALDVTLNDNGKALMGWGDYYDNGMAMTYYYTHSYIYDGTDWVGNMFNPQVQTYDAGMYFQNNKDFTGMDINDNAMLVSLYDNGGSYISQALLYDGTAWSTPQNLHGSADSSNAVYIAMNDDGQTAMVWLRNNSTIHISSYSTADTFPGITFTDNQVSTSTSDMVYAPVKVAINSSGNGIVAWMANQSAGGKVLCARRFTASGPDVTFPETDEMRVSVNSMMASSFDAGIADSGNIVLVWIADETGATYTYFLKAQEYISSKNIWTGEHELYTGTDPIDTIEMSMDKKGYATVVYSTMSGTMDLIKAVRYE